jgi:hypothetical protein
MKNGHESPECVVNGCIRQNIASVDFQIPESSIHGPARLNVFGPIVFAAVRRGTSMDDIENFYLGAICFDD